MKENRSFLKKALEAGLDCGEIEAKDLLAHVTPEALARHLPVELKAKLLGASLDAREMTPELIIEVVGAEALAEHTPVQLLWRCIKAAIERGLEAGAQLSAAPAEVRAPAASAPKSKPAAESKPAAKSEPAKAEAKVPARLRSVAPSRGAGAASRKQTARPARRSRASTETDGDSPAPDQVPAKPNASAYLEIEEVELEDGIDQLVADEPSDFGETPSLFDIDTKVGGPGQEAFAVGESDLHDDETSPGK